MPLDASSASLPQSSDSKPQSKNIDIETDVIIQKGDKDVPFEFQRKPLKSNDSKPSLKVVQKKTI